MNTIAKSGVVRLSKQGAPSVLQYTTETVGEPSKNQVLIRHEAIALNFVDVLFRNGSFPLNQLPTTIGVEAAGVIEAAGTSVSEFAAGDRVGYFFALGAYAERRLIDADSLIKLPDEVAFDTAASILAKGLTARMLIKEVYTVKPGDTVLVHAAAGGVGSLVTRWAKALGATVIGTIGNSSKKALAKSSGADHIIALDAENLTEQVNLYTHGQGVDVVLDGVGKATFGPSAQLLKQGGSLLLYGTASGEPNIDTEYLKSKNIQLFRPALMQYLASKQHIYTAARDLFDALRKGVFGDIKPTIYPLSDAAKAHQDLESGQTTGSIIFHA
jgi:NADPH2:quinone reductase